MQCHVIRNGYGLLIYHPRTRNGRLGTAHRVLVFRTSARQTDALSHGRRLAKLRHIM